MEERYVIDFCMVDEEDVIRKMTKDDEEYFEEYLEDVFNCSYVTEFAEEDIDKRFWILEDGGEAVRLKDGRYFETCFRGDMCAVWEAESDTKELFDEKVQKILKGEVK